MAFLDETGLAHLWKKIKLAPYPVGSIYTSENSTSPAELFGGSWEQLKDRFLLAAGDTYVAGSTGGEAKHALSVDELPEHRMMIYDQDALGNNAGSLCPSDKIMALAYSRATAGKRYWWSSTMPIGSNEGHNNMPPYLSVYMWKRIA